MSKTRKLAMLVLALEGGKRSGLRVMWAGRLDRFEAGGEGPGGNQPLSLHGGGPVPGSTDHGGDCQGMFILECSLPRISMTLKKWVHDPMILGNDPSLKGHGEVEICLQPND